MKPLQLLRQLGMLAAGFSIWIIGMLSYNRRIPSIFFLPPFSSLLVSGISAYLFIVGSGFLHVEESEKVITTDKA